MRNVSEKFRKVGRPKLKHTVKSLNVTLYPDDFKKLGQIKSKRKYISDSQAVRELIRRARV